MLRWQGLRPLKGKLIMAGILILTCISGWFISQEILSSTTRLRVSDPNAEERAENRVPKLLQRALEASGARSESARLESWGRVTGAFVDLEQASEIAAEAAHILALNSGLAWKKEQSPNFRTCFWEGEVEPGTFLYLSVQSLKGPGAEGETYLLVNWESQTKEGEVAYLLSRWEQQAAKVFSKFQVDHRLTYTITAQIPGYLSPEERRRRAESILAALEATRLEGIEDGEMLSLSAYTPLLPQHLEITGRRVNLNVGLRYHGTDNITYLHLGSPLLGGEY